MMRLATSAPASVLAATAAGIVVALHGWRVGALWSTVWRRWRSRWRKYLDRPLVHQRAPQPGPSLRRRFPW